MQIHYFLYNFKPEPLSWHRKVSFFTKKKDKKGQKQITKTKNGPLREKICSDVNLEKKLKSFIGSFS